MRVPAQYQGREQSYLKHRVLEEYLLAWGHKLGSLAQRRRVRLCYVDGFAGPWQAKDAALADTSISIGLEALEAAVKTWRDKGHSINVDAYFVEKDPHAFASLERFIKGRTGRVHAQAFPGEFGAHVGNIRRLLGGDPGFVFVDPTGWKGAAMRFIAPLLADSRQRDVLVNVMFDHINRFKDDPRHFLREQMREFFGLADRDMPAALSEEELFALYRRQLKEQCGVEYAADLAIPHPTVERTKFRLVVGGNSPAVLEVFRDAERKVIGAEAASVRDQAALRAKEEKTGQLTLLAAPPATDSRYESLHARALAQAPRDVLARLATKNSLEFRKLWPELLEAHHVTRPELGKLVWKMYKEGTIRILNLKPDERSVKDDHVLATRTSV
ncbi:three-Cys-motif partner protein TcmP [Sorangium sp. So ce204]|uniref:three-Cys-motif partner protein TcmP n=1 Tax=Sorangium sp. So ce204 TaxID=3133288 RepID=UPI003F60E751